MAQVLFPKGKVTKFVRTRGFSKLPRFRDTENLVNPLSLTLQSILALLAKSEDPPKKERIFLPAEPLKSLEKRAKTHKKSKQNQAEREKRGKRKKQGKEEGQGCLDMDVVKTLSEFQDFSVSLASVYRRACVCLASFEVV